MLCYGSISSSNNLSVPNRRLLMAPFTMQHFVEMNVSNVDQPLMETTFACTLLCKEALLLGITLTPLPHRYSRSVARETDGMPLQVSAEVGVKASLPHDETGGVEATR